MATTQTPAPPRKKRKISIFWLVMLSPVVLVILISVAAVWHHYHLDSQIEAELKKISDAGAPVTPADLADRYRLPADAVDRTAEWLAVMEQVKQLVQDPDYKALPIIGTGESAIPKPGQPWTDKQVVDQLMADAEPAFAEIEQLAQQPGAVRFPRKFEQGFALLLPNVQELRNIARMLSLRARWQVYQGDSAGAAESLIAMRRTADTIQHDPILVSHLVRIAILSMMQKDVVELMPHANWNDEQLKRWQDELLTGDTLHRDLVRAMEGERVMGNLAFDDPSAISPDIPATFSVTRRADQLYYLQTFDRLIAASEESHAEAIKTQEAIENEMAAQSGLQRLRHAMTIMILPAMSASTKASGRVTAGQRVVAALIACRRYKLATGQWPTKLDDLTPQFLDTVPTDPFDGQPLRFKATSSEIVVWSIGQDFVDDGGVNVAGNDWEPDILFRLEKFD